MNSSLPAEYQHVAERLGELTAQSAGEWVARCPAHDDSKPSLWIKLGRGRLIVKCRCGCETAAVLTAAGLTWRDLFERGANMETTAPQRKAVKAYDYVDEQGKQLFQVIRYEPKDFRQRRRATPDDDPAKVRNGWVWSVAGTRTVLYRLTEVLAAPSVIVVEGEKDADRIASLKLDKVAATTAPCGAGKWEYAYSRSLEGKSVVILPDNDEPGRKHAADVAKSLGEHAKAVRIVELPGLPPKGDVSDWLDAGHTAAELLAVIRVEQLRPVAPPTEHLTPADMLALVAVVVAEVPASKSAGERLARHLRSKGVLA